jgi:hypothetical protein
LIEVELWWEALRSEREGNAPTLRNNKNRRVLVRDDERSDGCKRLLAGPEGGEEVERECGR